MVLTLVTSLLYPIDTNSHAPPTGTNWSNVHCACLNRNHSVWLLFEVITEVEQKLHLITVWGYNISDLVMEHECILDVLYVSIVQQSCKCMCNQTACTHSDREGQVPFCLELVGLLSQTCWFQHWTLVTRIMTFMLSTFWAGVWDFTQQIMNVLPRFL